MTGPTYPTSIRGSTAKPVVLVDPSTGEPYAAGGSGSSLGAVATTAAPTLSEGASVATSTDLAGNTRVIDGNLGKQADAAATSDTGSFSLISLFKRLLQYMADTTAAAMYSLPTTPVSGTSAAITDMTDHLILAAPTAGLRNYITGVVISNTHASVDTEVVLKDGASGTVLATFPAAHLYGGVAFALPSPLKQPATATAIYAADLTTGASVKVTLVGFQAA